MNSLPPGYALVSTFRVRRWLLHLSSLLTLVLAQAGGIGMVLLHSIATNTHITLMVVPWAIGVLVGVPLLVVVHELLHAAAALSQGVPRKHIGFGFGGLAVHCQIRHAMPIRSSRKVFALPLVVTALVTAAWTLLGGSLLASTLFAFAVGMAMGDIAMVWKTRGADPEHVIGTKEGKSEFIVLRRVEHEDAGEVRGD
jgi:Putative zincin peptidase